MKRMYIGSGVSSLAAFIANKEKGEGEDAVIGKKVELNKNFLFDVHYSEPLYQVLKKHKLVEAIIDKKIGLNVSGLIVAGSSVKTPVMDKLLAFHDKKTWRHGKESNTTLKKDKYTVVKLKKGWAKKLDKIYGFSNSFVCTEFNSMEDVFKIAQTADATYSSLSENVFTGVWQKIAVLPILPCPNRDAFENSGLDVIYFPASPAITRAFKDNKGKWHLEMLVDDDTQQDNFQGGFKAYPRQGVETRMTDENGIIYIGRYATGTKELFHTVFEKVFNGK